MPNSDGLGISEVGNISAYQDEQKNTYLCALCAAVRVPKNGKIGCDNPCECEHEIHITGKFYLQEKYKCEES